METAMEKSKLDLQFTYLPAFAKFLLDKHLPSFVKEQVRLSRELDLPLLKYFSGMNEDELLAFSKKSAADLLEYLADNRAAQQIEDSRQRWLKDQVPNVSREQVIAQDITGVSYIRKQSLIKFIPQFTTNTDDIIALVNEINQYTYSSETILANTYISIISNRLEQREADLLQNQQLYKQAQALAHLGHWSWDLDTNRLEWTDEVFAIYGLTPTNGSLQSDDIRHLNHPDDADMVQSIMAHSMQTHEPYDFHYRIVLQEGTVKTLHAKGEVVVDANGRAYKMLGTLQDVTERQNLIEQLQLSEKLYKEAQALSHIGNWTWIIKENKVMWSDELYRIYGLDPQAETITFERYASFIHTDDKEELFNTIQNALLSKKPYELHHRIVRPDGSVRSLNAKGQVVLDEHGQAVRMTGTAQDITERMEVEREAQESQRFIQKIANATPALIASYNTRTGQYRYISDGLQKLLGYSPERPMKEGVQFFIEIMHPDDFGPVMEKNAQALDMANAGELAEGSEGIVEFEYRLRHANGEYRWFHTFGTVFDRDASGQVEYLLNISIDITERKEMETALSQKNVQLQQSNASLEEFAYVASHDLKEPLRKISIFGDRLLSTQYERLAGEGQFYLEKIIDSSRKMQLLINDMLSLSLISENKSFARYSLQSILAEVMRTLEIKIAETGAIIHAQPLPEANIIPSQFRQLFQNLLSNSLKFVKQGVKPEINISCRKLKPHEAERHNLPGGRDYLELTFMDNGIGFDNIFAGKIFAIFQRLHHKDYEGTGIGLAICKKIIENHGGVIQAAGIPGQGATFTIIIPV